MLTKELPGLDDSDFAVEKRATAVSQHTKNSVHHISPSLKESVEL